MIARTLVVAAGLAISFAAAADEPIVLRMATVAPEGTVWAREVKSFGVELAKTTADQVRIKWYLGGVAGDEAEMLDRLNKGQLDGFASGGMACERIAPSFRVLGLPGVFQNRDESSFGIRQLFPTLEEEAQHNGYVLIGTTGLGPTVIFSRTPVRSMTELKKIKLWQWDLWEVAMAADKGMGLNIVGTPIFSARRAYDEARTDGFIAIPAAALAFQWSAQARFITDLRMGYLNACIVFSNRAFDRLSLPVQQAVRVGAARVSHRLEDFGRQQDEALLSGGLFTRQGLTQVPVSNSFRSEFFAAARAARERLAESLVSRKLLARVQQILADYRAEHASR